jgi:hypothetical protein
MINLVNRDRTIYDLEYRVVDIIKEYQTTGKVEMSTNKEGICLDKAKFYELLDYICDKFNIDKSKITIYTHNFLESHCDYNIVKQQLLHFKKFVDIEFNTNKSSDLKHMICLIGKINWNRMIIGSWLHCNFKDKIMMSFNYTHSDAEKLNSELTALNFYSEKDLEDAVLFLKHTPLTIDNHFDAFNDAGFIAQYQVINYYNQIFLDLVCETYIMGETFFPTEKTFRPIKASTPFIVLGPKNYLQNLKSMGFKTFNQWWDESYDYCEGAHRIDEIKKVITIIMSWPQEKLQQTLIEMKDILNHNFNILTNLKDSDMQT